MNNGDMLSDGAGESDEGDCELPPWLAVCDCGETTYEKGEPNPCACAVAGCDCGCNAKGAE